MATIARERRFDNTSMTSRTVHFQLVSYESLGDLCIAGLKNFQFEVREDFEYNASDNNSTTSTFERVSSISKSRYCKFASTQNYAPAKCTHTFDAKLRLRRFCAVTQY